MADHICPVWVGYLLASPVRRIFQSPDKIVGPHVKEGMTVLDMGCAMGFFSVPMATMVGADGRVVCVDVQEKMLESLRKRAVKAGVDDRMKVLNCAENETGLEHLRGDVDFALAFAMVHEVDDPEALIRQIHSLLRNGGHLLVAEPRGHVSSGEFDDTLRWSTEAGLTTVDRPAIGRSHAALLKKSD